MHPEASIPILQLASSSKLNFEYSSLKPLKLGLVKRKLLEQIEDV
jgi:hypothetical protein